MELDIYEKFKKIKILREVSNETLIVLGMLNNKWNGVIEYPEKLRMDKAESKTKIDTAFLFYKVSPPTYKERMLIEKYLKSSLVDNSLKLIKSETDDFKSENLLYSEIIGRNLNRIEINLYNQIEKLKLIQLGQVYGEFYSNVLLMKKDSYTHVVFYSY
ncbi:hypothetical protein ACP3VS_13290 [Lysinibacillus sp. VIII_CA]